MSDIDGTILDKNHQLDSHLIELMPLLKQSEIPFVLASARSPLGIAPISKELGITDFPIASYNGALISTGDKILSQHSINKKELLLYRVYDRFPAIDLCFFVSNDLLPIITLSFHTFWSRTRIVVTTCYTSFNGNSI